MKKIISIAFTMTFVITQPAFADQHRDITSEYVAGFLAGANLTDGAILENIDTNNESEFLQRAYRTRLGNKYRMQATYLAGYCLPEGVTNDTLIHNIINSLKNTAYPENTARDVLVYNTIKSLYPCKE